MTGSLKRPLLPDLAYIYAMWRIHGVGNVYPFAGKLRVTFYDFCTSCHILKKGTIIYMRITLLGFTLQVYYAGAHCSLSKW